MSVISNTVGSSVAGYAVAAALAVGLAGGWGASHFIVVVPMRLAESKAQEERTHAALAGTMKTLTTERETQDAMQVLVKDWRQGDPVARARSAALVDRLRHPAEDPGDGAVREVHGAAAGTCDDRLRAARGIADDIDRATADVAEAAARAVEGFDAARGEQRSLKFAQGLVKACEALTRK